jgi:hypothetical protein
MDTFEHLLGHGLERRQRYQFLALQQPLEALHA